jgi:hypothetical protein
MRQSGTKVYLHPPEHKLWHNLGRSYLALPGKQLPVSAKSKQIKEIGFTAADRLVIKLSNRSEPLAFPVYKLSETWQALVPSGPRKYLKIDRFCMM